MIDRAINGVPRPIFYKGEQVGETRHFDERLAMFLLRGRRPWRYRRQAEAAPPPSPKKHDEENRRWSLFGALADIARNAPRERGNPVEDWSAEETDGDGADE